MQPFSSAMSEATVVISQMAALYMHIKKGLIKWDKAAPRSSYPYIVHPLAYTGQFINYNNTNGLIYLWWYFRPAAQNKSQNILMQ